ERVVHHADRAIDHGLAYINHARHVGDFFANQAEIRSHFAERFALFGVADSVFKGDARSTQAHRAQLEAPYVQDVESNDVALADFAKNIFRRYFAVVQDDRASR